VTVPRQSEEQHRADTHVLFITLPHDGSITRVMCCLQANLAMKINVKVGGVNTCWSVLGKELLRGYFNKEVCCAVQCCAVPCC
jgi:hypothetical protein